MATDLRPNHDTGKPVNGKLGSPKAVSAIMQRLAQEAVGQGVRSVPDDAAFKAMHPNLFDWLTATQVGDAFEKDRAKLAFSVEGSYWRVTLTDSALECSLSALGNTFQAALAALEEAVVHPDAPWQRFKQRGRKALRELREENAEGGGQQKKRR